MKRYPITKPCLGEEDWEALRAPIMSGWLVQGPNVREFERLFTEFTGIRHAVATSNCTTALHLGLLALGIKAGDRVVVPSFTYIATANAVEYCGAVPVFCDIDLATFNIDVHRLEQVCKREPRGTLKAVIPVSLFGLSADMPAIREIAREYHLKVLEDAACAFGATCNGKHAGALADAAAFSFHPRKAITTGEGGMLVTNDDEVAEIARRMRDHGAEASDLERHVKEGGSLLPEFKMLGYNYRMTDLQGALGVSQMNKADKILEGRKTGAAFYDKALSEIDWLITPGVPEGMTHAYQSYVALLSPGGKKFPRLEDLPDLNLKRNRLMADLEKEGISTRQGTHAVHTLAYYKNRYGLVDTDIPNSFIADRLSVTLPLFWDITEEDVACIVQKLQEKWDRD